MPQDASANARGAYSTSKHLRRHDHDVTMVASAQEVASASNGLVETPHGHVSDRRLCAAKSWKIEVQYKLLETALMLRSRRYIDRKHVCVLL